MSSNISIKNVGASSQNIAAGNGPQSNLNGTGTQNNYYGGTVHPMSSDTHHAEGLVSNRTRPSRREDFRIALICALPLEYDAVALQFDEFWDEDGEEYGRAPGDNNNYTTGRIGNHNVVLTILPNMGKTAAAGAAANFRCSYSRLRLALLVGICGGAPIIGTDEAVLGDVIISRNLIQYDIGRQFPNAFVMKDTLEDNLGRANKDIRSLVASFETELGRERLRKKAGEYLSNLQATATRKRRRYGYRYLGVVEDKLFPATYQHKHRAPQSCDVCEGETERHCEEAAQASCAELNCDQTQLLSRDILEVKMRLELNEMQCPDIFVGRIASGDTVVKSGKHRDQLARELNVVAFEMEGAGAWDEVPCIVIKGICDYADSHKNKKWQPFAAATASSVMKAVLGRYATTDRPTSA
ncbi:purine and uridine phosphorylase [Xylaria bambusicola]|uniref:purine and uridine phosphorylase n=1 Tax=Xylaria bambusicola TaxID=326684 RepID=UPI0020077D95|nr:purine and uridine phosphorylase [Xylaria bambusicola]KAI0502758.1 purine and uridine phosphorylase [Xylaria bambusicola]